MMLVISVSSVAAEGAFSLQNNIKPNAKCCSGKDLTQKKAPPLHHPPLLHLIILEQFKFVADCFLFSLNDCCILVPQL